MLGGSIKGEYVKIVVRFPCTEGFAPYVSIARASA